MLQQAGQFSEMLQGVSQQGDIAILLLGQFVLALEHAHAELLQLHPPHPA